MGLVSATSFDRLHSLIAVKSLDDERRTITGIATTPEPDQLDDVVDPLGIAYKNPLPLLLYHDKTRPVGTAIFDRPTAAGVAFTAQLPEIPEAGALRDRVEEAWHSLKHGVIRGVSIGFTFAAQNVERRKSGGLLLRKVNVFELSLVATPANAAATILTVKSCDVGAEAALGQRLTDSSNPAGAAAQLPSTQARKGAAGMEKTIAEQISELENTAAANDRAMRAIMMEKSAEDRTDDDREEYDRLKDQNKRIDGDRIRLKDMEKSNLEAAKVVDGRTPEGGTLSRGPGSGRIQMGKPNLPKGTHFTRYVMAVARGGGDMYKTIEHARQWHDSTPEVEEMVKAAVAAGTTTDSTWAGPLAPTQPLIDEFLELLRPRTLLGRVPGFRAVPFNVSVPSQTGGGTYSWVAEGNAKPVTSAAFGTVSVGKTKAAGIIVLTEELVRLSTPSAEATVREEMIAGMGAFLDTQLVDPAVAAVANTNPASITNGAATAAASAVTGAGARADLAARVAVFTAANVPLEGSVWLMSDSNAFGLGLSLNALGQPLFPGFGINGGTIMGIPVVVSNNVGNRVILVHAPSILFADEGQVRIDVSREASVQMDSAPTNPSDATTVLVSFWQRNLVGLRCERMINWVRARTAAVTYISAAAYNGT